MIHYYGYKPDQFDHRDKKYGVEPAAAVALPPAVDVSAEINWVYDQGNENSCVAQSTSSLLRYIRLQQKLPEIDPSRNFLYYCARVLENDVNDDGGLQIRDALKVLSSTGYCSETLWGYYPSTLFAVPAKACYTAAAQNLVTEYVSISQDHNSLRSTLAKKIPFVFGIEVFESLESDTVANTGIVPMPKQNDKVLGGHAIMCVGYDDNKQLYKFLNSWSSAWGDKGYGYLPYDFIENGDLAGDFWTITTLITKEAAPIISGEPYGGATLA